MKNVIPRPLAIRISLEAHSLTCPTDPAEEDRSSVYTACMESIIQNSTPSSSLSRQSMQVSFIMRSLSGLRFNRSVLSLTCEQLSSAEK